MKSYDNTHMMLVKKELYGNGMYIFIKYSIYFSFIHDKQPMGSDAQLAA